MEKDISGLLREWEYDSENSVRLIAAEDGRQVMQVRLPLGIEQYELDGRPDGSRPFDRTTVLEEFQHRVKAFETEHGEDGGFSLSHNDFVMLQNEGILYYYRYLLLFQIGDYERTSRDTEHNLRLCSFVEKYCTNAEDQKSLLQYKPYIIRVNALSRSMLNLARERKEDAVKVLEQAIESIAGTRDVDTPVFQFEKLRSLSHLKNTLKDLKEQDVGEIATLEEKLQRAVDDENYEQAAELRDAIATLRRREDA